MYYVALNNNPLLTLSYDCIRYTSAWAGTELTTLVKVGDVI